MANSPRPTVAIRQAKVIIAIILVSRAKVKTEVVFMVDGVEVTAVIVIGIVVEFVVVVEVEVEVVVVFVVVAVAVVVVVVVVVVVCESPTQG